MILKNSLIGLAILAIASPAQATLVLNLLVAPGGNGNVVNTWTFQADGSSVVVTGGTTFDTVGEGLTGSLVGASGSFTITATSVESFDSGDFSAGVSTGTSGAGTTFWSYNGASDTYGVASNAPNELGIQISGYRLDEESSTGFFSEAMLMAFDLTNLTLAPGFSLQVDGFQVQNENGAFPAGQRISYLEGGFGSGNTPVQLTGNSGQPNALVGGAYVFQPLNQTVGTGDEIAIWAEDNSGQKRFAGFQFTVIPEPSSAALIVLGSIGLVLRRRRN